MKRQFLKLFISIIATLLLVAWLTEYIFEKNALLTPEIDMQQVFTAIEKHPKTLMEQVAMADLAWPADLLHKLESGQIVSLVSDNETVTYYRRHQLSDSVIKVGPVMLQSNNTNHHVLIPLLFYSCFGFLLLLWLWPMFRDIRRLMMLSGGFSQTREPIVTNINKNSFVYPLALAVEQMSSQIWRFIQLQRFLASSVSHDIRTPLSRIEFLLEMTNTSNLETSKGRLQYDLDEIESLTHDFIELARLEEDHGSLTLRQSDLIEWLTPLVQQMNSSAPARIELNCPDYVSFIHDKNFLRRAVQNLVANALKYAELHILISVRVSGQEVIICVEDDGPGIKIDEQEQLKGLFERGKAKSNKGSGYGIGLAFVNVICQWHRGQVTICSSERIGGAKIMLRLPVKPQV